jgi:hypothetical protein
MSSINIVGLDDVLASIPAMLSFVPSESLIFLPLVSEPDGTTILGTVSRFELADITAMPAIAALQLSVALADQPVVTMLGVVTTATGSPDSDLPLRSAVEEISTCLSRQGFPDLEALFLPSFTTGARWTCYEHSGHSGVLPDPGITALAVVRTVQGESIMASRDELALRFTFGPDSDRERLRPLVTTAARIVRFDDAANDLRMLRGRLTSIERAVREVREGRYPERDVVVAELIAAFATPRLRDAMLITREHDAIVPLENLALYLWKLAEEPYATHLATVAAASAYRRGDGAAAATAVDAASGDDGLAQLIAVALRQAVRPAKVEEIFHRGAQAARADLGIPSQP